MWMAATISSVDVDGRHFGLKTRSSQLGRLPHDRGQGFLEKGFDRMPATVRGRVAGTPSLAAMARNTNWK